MPAAAPPSPARRSSADVAHAPAATLVAGGLDGGIVGLAALGLDVTVGETDGVSLDAADDADGDGDGLELPLHPVAIATTSAAPITRQIRTTRH